MRVAYECIVTCVNVVFQRVYCYRIRNVAGDHDGSAGFRIGLLEAGAYFHVIRIEVAAERPRVVESGKGTEVSFARLRGCLTDLYRRAVLVKEAGSNSVSRPCIGAGAENADVKSGQSTEPGLVQSEIHFRLILVARFGVREGYGNGVNPGGIAVAKSAEMVVVLHQGDAVRINNCRVSEEIRQNCVDVVDR